MRGVPPSAAVLTDRRSNRLGRGLQSLGVGPGDRVVVLCCAEHATDCSVGALAAGKAGASATCIPVASPVAELRRRLLEIRPALILACREGVAAWRETGVACQVVGDETGVTWWKLLEVRHSPAPFPADDGALDLVS
jgi:acyl-coenzyme A synthetase/AMP-(fatty) acid ligase